MTSTEIQADWLGPRGRRCGSNPRCPDYSPHSENAIDRLYPDGLPNDADWDVIDAEAEAEYQNCEGH